MNKKSILGVLAILLCSLSLNTINAQVNLKAGVTLSQLKTKLGIFSGTTDNKLGVQLGATKDVALSSENIYLRPGITYTMKGGSDSSDGETATVTFHYIEVPVDFVYDIAVSENAIALHAGPYLGYLLAATSEGESDKEGLKDLDFGFNVGATYKFGQYGIGLNISRGLSNVADLGDVDLQILGIDGEISTKPRYISIFFTYAL